MVKEDLLFFSQLPVVDVLEWLPVAVSIIRLSDDTFFYSNKACKELFGISSGECLERKGFEFCDKYFDYTSYVKQLKSNASTQGKEVMLLRADRSAFWGNIYSKLIEYHGQSFGVNCIEDISEHKKLFDAAMRDYLTGSMNRRFLFEQIEDAFQTYQKELQEFAILMMDLDHFKTINDTYGHMIGDQAIIHFVENCRKCLRQFDCFGRVGGEEFLAVLPKTGLTEAKVVGHAIRRTLVHQPYLVGGKVIPMTVSIGVAVINAIDTSIHDAVARADTALYLAKKNGRNCIVG